MKLVFFLVSESAAIDKETDRVSVFHIIQDIDPDGLPLVIPRMILCWAIELDKDDPEGLEGNLTIRNNDRVIHTSPVKHEFQGKGMARFKITLNGLPIFAPGKVVFEFAVERPELRAEYSISVSTPPNTATATEAG